MSVEYEASQNNLKAANIMMEAANSIRESVGRMEDALRSVSSEFRDSGVASNIENIVTFLEYARREGKL